MKIREKIWANENYSTSLFLEVAMYGNIAPYEHLHIYMSGIYIESPTSTSRSKLSFSILEWSIQHKILKGSQNQISKVQNISKPLLVYCTELADHEHQQRIQIQEECQQLLHSQKQHIYKLQEELETERSVCQCFLRYAMNFILMLSIQQLFSYLIANTSVIKRNRNQSELNWI